MYIVIGKFPSNDIDAVKRTEKDLIVSFKTNNMHNTALVIPQSRMVNNMRQMPIGVDIK